MTRPRFEKLLLLLGLVAIGFWAWSHIHTSIFQKWASGAFDRSIHNPAPAPDVAPSVKSGDLLGRLTIPRLHLSAMVREGDDAQSLDVALGHIPGTPLPGQSGNVAIAGHRDTLFRGLGKVSTNDLIQFETRTGDYSYRVESTTIVKPRNVEVLHSAGYSEITLVTCYPFNYVGSAPDRFIVKARLVPIASDMASATVSPKLSHVVSAKLASATTPSPSKPLSKPPRENPPPGGKVAFHVTEGHSCQLGSGIELGLSSADASGQRVNAWLSIGPQRHISLPDQRTNTPITFRGGNGGIHELIVTSVVGDSATGYLLNPSWR